MSRRSGILVVVLLLASLRWGVPEQRVAAQSEPPPGYTVISAGWNLISTAGAATLRLPSAFGPLYTLQAGDKEYEALGLDQLQRGAGYWAFFRDNTAVRLPPSADESYSVDVPAGQWIMVGNPSTAASARIAGADTAFVYSPLSGYRQDTLVPVGYGAFVYSASGGTITVEVRDTDRSAVDFQGCCTVGTGNYGGKAHIEIYDDSPYSLFYGVRSVLLDGSFPAPASGNYAYGALSACDACPEYAEPPTACGAAATARTVTVDPGEYLIRLTSDGARVADIILTTTLDPNTRYYLCRWVAANRS